MTAAARTATRRLALLALAVGLAALVAGCGSSSSSGGGGSAGASTTGATTGAAASGKKIKVAWLWYGPKNDGGYNVSQWRPAQQEIAAKYGSRVQQIDVEKVPYSARGTQMAEQVMRDGADLVIDAVAAGSLFTDACARHLKVKCIEVGPVGGKYPDATASLPKNVSGVFHEFWFQEYVLGMVAGRTTKTNTVGFVGSYNNPSVIGSANAFALGCIKVNPACKERLIITNDYFNPPAAVQASNTLVNAGADVLHGWTDDPGFCEVAEKRKVHVVGQFIDYRDHCPTAFLSSALWNYAPYYVSEVGKVLDGTWTPHRSTYLKLQGGAQGGADIPAKWGQDVPASVQKEVADEIAAIKGGANPFVGPIYDSKGKLRVKAGQTLGPEFLYNQWSWTVRGVTS